MEAFLRTSLTNGYHIKELLHTYNVWALSYPKKHFEKGKGNKWYRKSPFKMGPVVGVTGAC